MTQLSPARATAIRHLLRCSAVAEHPHINRSIDIDAGRVDIEKLDDYGWSSGEEVLIELIKLISGFHSNLKVADLWKLDSINREVAIKSLEMTFTGHGLGTQVED